RKSYSTCSLGGRDIRCGCRFGKVRAQGKVLGVNLSRLETADVARAGDKVALAANVVNRNRGVSHYLALHAEVIEHELRSAARKIRIRKRDACTDSAGCACRSVAWSECLPRTDIKAGALRLADCVDRCGRRKNKAWPAEVGIGRRECWIVIEVEGRPCVRTGRAIGKGGRAVKSRLARSRASPTRSAGAARMRVE